MKRHPYWLPLLAGALLVAPVEAGRFGNGGGARPAPAPGARPAPGPVARPAPAPVARPTPLPTPGARPTLPTRPAPVPSTVHGPFGSGQPVRVPTPVTRPSVIAGGSKTGTIIAGDRTASGGKVGGVVIGPNGNLHAGGIAAGQVTGPNGSATGIKHGHVTIGPGGLHASGGKVGVATGPGGTIAAGSRGSVTVGPHGAAASGIRAVGGTTAQGSAIYGTRYVAGTTLRGQGVAVRQSFGYYNTFNAGWYKRYPSVWYPPRYVGPTWNPWRPVVWNNYYTFVGYPTTIVPIYYNYGDNVVYANNNVYYGNQVVATQIDYATQATRIATAGAVAIPADQDQWQPLGVFALVQGDATTANELFQLALNSAGQVRGNYYNATTDITLPVTGSLDKTSQRLAWTIGTNRTTVFETGLYNLTQAETTLLVHFGTERTEQHRFFRVEQTGN